MPTLTIALSASTTATGRRDRDVSEATVQRLTAMIKNRYRNPVTYDAEGNPVEPAPMTDAQALLAWADKFVWEQTKRAIQDFERRQQMGAITTSDLT